MITLYQRPVPINSKLACVRGRAIATKRYRDAKLALQQEIALKWTTEPFITPLEVIIHQYFWDKRKRDIDAHLKIILDAMEGVVYDNDNQIQVLHTTKHYDKENPRIEVEIHEIQ